MALQPEEVAILLRSGNPDPEVLDQAASMLEQARVSMSNVMRASREQIAKYKQLLDHCRSLGMDVKRFE